MTEIEYRDYPSQAELRETFDYHPDGYLIWKIQKGKRVKIGDRAGIKNPRPGSGYYLIKYNRRPYYNHILIWIWHNGDIPVGMEIDHIKNVSLGGNDDINNLQLLSRHDNMKKKKTRVDASEFGVGVYRPHNRFKVEIGNKNCLTNYRNKTFATHIEALQYSIEVYDDLGYHVSHYQRNIDLLEQLKSEELKKAA